MTSTERRIRRDNALLEKWAGITPGTRVRVNRANGDVLKTEILLGPYSVNGSGAYVLVRGIPGNTALHRVAKGWR